MMTCASLAAQSGSGMGAGTIAQGNFPSLERGINLYAEGKWRDAINELRRAQNARADRDTMAESIFWISLAELSLGDYESALRDMEYLEIMDSSNQRITEMKYHKGRALFYLGRHSDAIVILKAYTDAILSESTQDRARRTAAYYWIGECLYAAEVYDDAEKIFNIIIQNYPESVKFEAASYRVELIAQKRIEAGLQKQIDLNKEDYRRKLQDAETRIQILEGQLRNVRSE
ncbi:MAG: tetratricopeptide repeat protein [Treponema sp.]|nr:tetratricopeptide repeat protein [Treponema sp.]